MSDNNHSKNDHATDASPNSCHAHSSFIPLASGANRSFITATVAPKYATTALQYDSYALPLGTTSYDLTEIQPTGDSLLTNKAISLLSEAATFHPFSKLPPEIRLMIWLLALPMQRVVEILEWEPQLTLSVFREVVTRRYSIALLSVCREDREFGLASKKLGFFPSVKDARYLTPNNLTLLFINMDALHTFSVSIQSRTLWTELEDTFLVHAVDPRRHRNRYSQSQSDCVKDFDGFISCLLRLLKRTRSLMVMEVILFCRKEDMALVSGVEKFLKEEWNKDNEILERHLRSLSTTGRESQWREVGWRAPRVTPMVHKPDYSLPQTDAQIDDNLSLMRDMLSGFKSF
ncbi:hypothetical protein V8E51_008911 [Hyaloscypha variabilis]